MKNQIRSYSPIGFIAVMVLLFSGAMISPASAASPRLASLQPFSSSSVWNTSMGTGAIYEKRTDAKTANFLTGGAGINSNNGYGIAMNRAQDIDPLATVTMSWGTYTLRIPVNAKMVSGTDGNLNVIDPAGQFVYEFWKIQKISDTQYSAAYGVRTDLLGSGTWTGIRAAGFSTNAGLIRKHEVAQLRIPHALVLAIRSDQLKSGPVWPAHREDQGVTYSGKIPMGSLLAIPPTTNLSKLGLSAEGLALARALQNYGAYVGDTATNDVLFATSDVESDLGSAFARMRNDFVYKIISHLRVVTNSTSTSIGGGGTRLQPALAPVSAG